ncbi:hypothetical protein AB0F15_13790 [Amycolatopsis sp. NPDC026612]|uniref:hypothetical protein n=1 Tax=Amycolatopsis sp. NPDC026612 TaxID=3155466 RepID=UPI0033E5362E
MTELERRYRRVLRLLPASYRQAWEQDMVATFLAGAVPDDPEDAEFTAEYGRPGWAEVVSVLGLAVRLRLGGAGAPAHFRVWGGAMQRAALAVLLVYAVNALAGVRMLLWLPLRFPGLVVLGQSGAAALLGLSWVAAYLALVLGHRQLARLLMGLSLLLSAVTAGAAVVAGGGAYWGSRVAELLVSAFAVVAASAAFHRDAEPVRSRPWLTALPVGAVLVTVVLLLIQHPGDGVLVDGPGLACAALIAAVLFQQITSAAERGGSAGMWPVALVLLTFAALGLRVVTLLDYLTFTARASRPNALVTAAIVEAVVLVLVTGPLAVRAFRTLPRATHPADPRAGSRDA